MIKSLLKVAWPFLPLLFPPLFFLILQIEPITHLLWQWSEPLRLQHTSITGSAYSISQYIQLVLTVSIWNSLLITSIFLIARRFKDRFSNGLKDCWNTTPTLGQMAIYRIVIFSSLLFLLILNYPASMSLLPDELQDPPFFWGFLKGTFLLEPTWVSLVSLLAQATSITAVIGFQGPLSARIATISSFFVLLVPQSYGKVDHYHLLWWASFIWAWSPSWKVWSLDAWVNASKGEMILQPEVNSGFHGRFWLMLMMIAAYVFPGLWKWAWSGPLWALPDAMKVIAYNQWAVLQSPPIWKPQSDWLWASLGSFVLIIELGFPLILLGVKWRRVFIIGALLFHIGVWITFSIAFWHLAVLLPVIWPVKVKIPNNPTPSPDWKSPWFKVVLGFVVAGLFYLDSWPWGVYPGFSAALAPKVQTITLKKDEVVLWEMYRNEWGVGRRSIGSSRKMGIVTQVARSSKENRKQKLKALQLFLSTGPDSLMFRDSSAQFDLDLKLSGPFSPK